MNRDALFWMRDNWNLRVFRIALDDAASSTQRALAIVRGEQRAHAEHPSFPNR